MVPSSRSSTDTGRRGMHGWRSALSLQRHSRWAIALAFSAAGALVAMTLTAVVSAPQASARLGGSVVGQHQASNSAMLIAKGKQTFRFATFGDEAFWGGTLGLNKTIAGAANGGIGPGLSPKEALALGLKVDVNALPKSLQQAILAGQVNLDDPAVTLALLKLNAVVGVKGFFDSSGNLSSVGIECALCHSTVDNSLAPGIGHRLDGWANRDLNVGAIIGFAPNLQPIAKVLGTSVATVHKVLNAWGPGKFDAELLLDGKAFQPNGDTSAALEMHGHGDFFDSRLNNAQQFPIAAKNGFGHVVVKHDQVTPKLPGLQAYELSLKAPTPPKGSFNRAMAAAGKNLFDGAAQCSTCHVPPIFTEPGWNLVTGNQIGISNFEANRSPTFMYRTTPLAGLWTHQKGGFYQTGRFPTLLAVVQHYNKVFHLHLTRAQENDLVQYLLSI